MVQVLKYRLMFDLAVLAEAREALLAVLQLVPVAAELDWVDRLYRRLQHHLLGLTLAHALSMRLWDHHQKQCQCHNRLHTHCRSPLRYLNLANVVSVTLMLLSCREAVVELSLIRGYP